MALWPPRLQGLGQKDWSFISLFLISHSQGLMDAMGLISDTSVLERDCSHVLTPFLAFEIR